MTKKQPIHTIRVEEEEVEVLRSSEEKKPKVQKIKADDEHTSSGQNPFEDLFSGNTGGANPFQNSPFGSIIKNIEEFKKIKSYFFFSILCGFIGLFVLPEYLGTAAIVLGGLDLWKGSRLTKTASYFGIFLGIISLLFYIT